MGYNTKIQKQKSSIVKAIPSSLTEGEVAVYSDASGQIQFFIGNKNNLPVLVNDDAIIITSIQTSAVNKPTENGFYIFTVTPLDGLPVGIALNDIAYLYNSVWYLTRTYFSSPATIKVGLATQNVFTKNSNTWASLQNSIITGTSARKLFKGSPIINSRISPIGLAQNGANGTGIQVSTASTNPSSNAQGTYVGQTNAVDIRLLNAFAGNSNLNVTEIPIGTWTFRFTAQASATTGVQFFQNVFQIVNGLNTATITGAGANTRTVTLTSGQFSGTYFNANATNYLASYIQTSTGIYQITAITSTNVATITVPTGFVNETAVSFSIWNRLFSTANSPITSTLINTITPFAYTVIYEQNVVYNVASTDRLGVIDIANFTNATRTITVNFDGTANVNSVTTSIPISHNELPGLGTSSNLNGFNHLTNPEIANVALIPNKADKIPNALTITNLPTGGVIGLATATVDIFEAFNISQTTSGQTVTLPNPSVTTNQKLVYVSNTGTASFNLYGTNLEPKKMTPVIFNTTNGWLINSGGSGSSGATTLSIPNLTDLVTYTPTFTGYGTPTNVKFSWARRGPVAIILGYMNVGVTNNALASFSLPTGLTISSIFSTNYATVGTAVWGGDTTTSGRGYSSIAKAGDSVIYINYEGGNAGTQPNSLNPLTGSTLFANGQIITFQVEIPIQGWLANTTVNSLGQSFQKTSTPLASAIANSVTTVSNIKVRYNANGTGGNLDIACVSGTLTCQLIIGRQLFNGGLTTNAYTPSPLLTTTFTTYSDGGLDGASELLDYEIFVSNSELYEVKLRLTGNSGTDLVLINLTRIY